MVRIGWVRLNDEEIAVGEKLLKFLFRHGVFFGIEFKHVYIRQNQAGTDAQEMDGFKSRSIPDLFVMNSTTHSIY